MKHAGALMLVGTGGFIGSAARYMVTLMFSPLAPGFPFATFAVNIFGSFLIGFLVHVLVHFLVPVLVPVLAL